MREELIRQRREKSSHGRREEERQLSAHRLQQSINHPLLSIQQLQQCYRGLPWRYEHIVEQLFMRSHESERPLWQQFASLTVEQRQAVLHYAAKSKQHVEQILQTDHWQVQLKQAIHEVAHIHFQAQESMKEANIYESGAIEQYPIVHWQLEMPALIAPYREIVQWLMYKAKKQGEIALLHQLLHMSVPMQKLLLHRLAGTGRLQFKRFVDRMTVRIGWHDWVDWEALREQIMQVKQDGQQGEQYIAEQLVELEATSDSERLDSNRLDEEKYTEAASSAAMKQEQPALYPDMKEREETNPHKQQRRSSGSGVDIKAPNNKRMDTQQFEDSKWLLWLLTGLASWNKRSSKSKQDVIKRDEPLAVVQRFLGINAKLSGAKLEKVMKRQLRSHGFSSVHQCYVALITELITVLYVRAMVHKEKEYIQLLEVMGLLEGSTTVSKQQLATRFGITLSE